MQTHPRSNQGCNTHSQDVFTSVSSVNPITVSVAPPQTWLCTFLRSKNQGNQVLSHLVTAAFRFPGMHRAQSWAEPRDPAHSGDALKMHNEMDTGGKGPKKRGRIVFHIKDLKNLLQNLDTCRKQKPLVITKSGDRAFIVRIYSELQMRKIGERVLWDTHNSKQQSNKFTKLVDWVREDTNLRQREVKQELGRILNSIN